MREAEGHAPAPAYANPPPPLPEPSDRDREWHARRYDALAGGAGRDPPRDGGARYAPAHNASAREPLGAPTRVSARSSSREREAFAFDRGGARAAAPRPPATPSRSTAKDRRAHDWRDGAGDRPKHDGPPRRWPQTRRRAKTLRARAARASSFGRARLRARALRLPRRRDALGRAPLRGVGGVPARARARVHGPALRVPHVQRHPGRPGREVRRRARARAHRRGGAQSARLFRRKRKRPRSAALPRRAAGGDALGRAQAGRAPGHTARAPAGGARGGHQTLHRRVRARERAAAPGALSRERPPRRGNATSAFPSRARRRRARVGGALGKPRVCMARP